MDLLGLLLFEISSDGLLSFSLFLSLSFSFSSSFFRLFTLFLLFDNPLFNEEEGISILFETTFTCQFIKRSKIRRRLAFLLQTFGDSRHCCGEELTIFTSRTSIFSASLPIKMSEWSLLIKIFHIRDILNRSLNTITQVIDSACSRTGISHYTRKDLMGIKRERG